MKNETYSYEIHATIAPEHVERARGLTGARFLELVDYPDIPDTFSVWSTTAGPRGSWATLDTVREQLEMLAFALEKNGVPVLRRKIETVPWNPAPALYLETHLRVYGSALDVHAAALREHGGHYSWDPVRDKHWITLRTRRDDARVEDFGSDGLVLHSLRVGALVAQLSRRDIQVVRPPETESVILDTAPERDARWEGR